MSVRLWTAKTTKRVSKNPETLREGCRRAEVKAGFGQQGREEGKRHAFLNLSLLHLILEILLEFSLLEIREFGEVELGLLGVEGVHSALRKIGSDC